MKLIIFLITLGLSILYLLGYKNIRQKGKSIRTVIIPFVVNSFTACIYYYFFIIAILIISHNIYLDLPTILIFIVPFIIQTIINVLLYFLYYKNQNKLTAKEFFITCLCGVSSIFVYISFMTLQPFQL